jgi:hypothetical protein
MQTSRGGDCAASSCAYCRGAAALQCENETDAARFCLLRAPAGWRSPPSFLTAGVLRIHTLYSGEDPGDRVFLDLLRPFSLFRSSSSGTRRSGL